MHYEVHQENTYVCTLYNIYLYTYRDSCYYKNECVDIFRRRRNVIGTYNL